MGSMNCRQFSRTSVQTDDSNSTVATGQATTTVTASADTMTNDDDNTLIEHILCNTTDLEDNQMKQFELNDNGDKILLIKQSGQYTAIGAKCSHYGASLINGGLANGRIRCPWHGACFNIHTGDIEDFPGLDSIPCYQVNIDNENNLVKIQTTKKQLQNTKRIKIMSKYDENNTDVYVVIGGGPAGGVCVETLRQEGFTGEIILICKELSLPYDRIKVSKAMNVELKTLQYRTADFYDEHDIRVMLGTQAISMDCAKMIIECSNGYRIRYTKVFIATGSKAIKPNLPGVDLQNVVTLRGFEDAKTITYILNTEVNVVCLGSSFIALEAAAYCVNKVKSVTVIGRDDVPLQASFGSVIGARVKKLFEENDVKMISNSGIIKCNSNEEDNKITSIELIDNTVIPCDLLIMGTGTKPYTTFLNESGLEVNTNGSIDTNIYLQSTTHSDVYIGGDIANAPVFSLNNELATIGHYQLAQYHGKVAATNMVLNNSKELQAVPFFWTMLFNKNFRYAGHGNASDVIIDGSVEELTFVAMYLDANGYVCAMASCNRDPIVVEFAEFLSQGRKLHQNDLNGEDKFEWRQLLTQK